MGLIPVFEGNPRQSWQFQVRINGFNVAMFESAELPDVESEIDEFNPAGSVRPTKFSGRAKIGDCTAKNPALVIFYDKGIVQRPSTLSLFMCGW